MGYPQSGMGYPQAPQTHGKATASLICGILAFALCGIFTGIPALILGSQAMREIDASGGQLGGRGLATAGRILGIISIALTILVAILVAIIFIFGETDTTNEFGSLAG